RSASERGLRDRLWGSLVLQPVEIARFRDVPVLAELAGEVAPRRAEREHRRAGKKVVERLFFDRIDAESRRAPVRGEHDRVVVPRAHVAEAALALVKPAIARAEVALDAAVLELVPIAARSTGQKLIHRGTDPVVGVRLYSIHLGIARRRDNANGIGNVRHPP